ncbi:MAG TPA: alpha-amylase family glycosyl hydrolase [Gaiellales bacterium]|nr:alpha-amylase family glycosyl hydrolase [Gaiellales bacterium]
MIYQIYPRSFLDTTGDGVGDLAGITARLDYLRWLGVDAIWVSPFFRSPMADFGYDISDYCDVDPVFGTLADADRLIAGAHNAGIRVLLDWVPNHTSDQHPWFVDSRSSRRSPKRDWYYWRDGRRSGTPNNWRAAFGGPAWAFDDATRQWYLHLFLPQQPDLNWGNREVVHAMHGVLRFWLDRDVDGFRIDVVHLIGKDPALPDQPAELGPVDRVGIHDDPRTHGLLREIRRLVDSYPGERVIVGEVNLHDTSAIRTYYGAGDELHMAFNFLPLATPWTAADWREVIEVVERDLGREAWPTWVLSNHDSSRHRTRLGGSEAVSRAAAVLLLTLRGTPFLFQGEELGLEDAVVPRDRRVDPAGRDGCRAPIPWTGASAHGWATAETWLPWPPHAESRNVEDERADPGAILRLYRRLLAARRASPALRRGDITLLDAPAAVLAYRRSTHEDERIVLVNFGDAEVDVHLDGRWNIVVSSDPGVDRWDGALRAREAVILQPNAAGAGRERR